MAATSWNLRPARPDEMTALVAIDDDACTLYVDAGRDGVLPPWFVDVEQARWRRALDGGRVVVAVTSDDAPIGFASLGFVDSSPFLQQLSVRRAWMKRGVGRALMDHALAWGDGLLWLTTYADIAWNRPFYERVGFACVEESRCAPELRAILDEEKRALPAPEQRVAMVHRALST